MSFGGGGSSGAGVAAVVPEEVPGVGLLVGVESDSVGAAFADGASIASAPGVWAGAGANDSDTVKAQAR